MLVRDDKPSSSARPMKIVRLVPSTVGATLR